MIYGGTWMMEHMGRGGYRGGMWSNHMSGFGGDFDMFGPVSLITISIFSILFFLAILWTVAIKGYALWHAAKRNEKWWFIALLVINTFGILEIVYLVFVAKPTVFGGKNKVVNAEKKEDAKNHVTSSANSVSEEKQGHTNEN
jgi:methionyl-tRNA synthetase